jgi:cellulose synthase/poly-beta-1,6-N-acetylglucosamine synthase-like glycosyltransferase
LITFWGFIIFTGLLYLLLVSFIIFGWIRTKTFIRQEGIEQPPVSVIIPVRNETAGIYQLLSDLSNQNYPEDKYEVIIVDDHSLDSPESIISDLKRKIKIRVLYLGDDEYGKKAAVMKGLRASASDLVLTTDADCRIKPDWISEMANFFISQQVKLVFGSVQYQKSNKIHEWFQSLEFLSLIAGGAGFTGNGHPILCNAANMGYERNIYLEFMEEKKSDLPVSGDDVLFLLWLKKKYPDQIGFIKSLASLVETKPAISLKEFINQRLRWTSKSRYYRDIMILIPAFIIYVTSLSLFVSLAGAFFSGLLMKGFIFLFLLKCIIDLVLLFVITGYYRNRYLLIIFFPLEIIYFIYISIIGFAGNVVSFRWKGRKSKP